MRKSIQLTLFNDLILTQRADVDEAREMLEALKSQGIVIGTDEAGRGALAGPVVAAAVYLTQEQEDELLAHKLRDSKRLTPCSREKIFAFMNQIGVEWSAYPAGIDVIESQNILRASLFAMNQSICRLIKRMAKTPNCVIVDGNTRIPDLPFSQWTLIKADDLIPVVSAASVVAKVIRDRLMKNLDERYPGYNFAKNKGYPTQQHIDTVRRKGICGIHRESFCRKFLLNRR